MNTLYFKYALEVARTQSISQAAENLFMAQPNLSKAIKELENSLNITIFERSSKGVVPTQQGAAFLEYAGNVVSEIGKMKQISENANTGKLEISVPSGFNSIKVITDFIKQNKDAKLSIDIRRQTSLETIESLIKNNCRIGLCRVEKRDRENFENYCSDHGLRTSLVWEFTAKVTVSDKSFLANKQICTNEMLSNMIRISEKEEDLPYRIKRKNFFSGFRSIYVESLLASREILKIYDKYWMWDSPLTREYMKEMKVSQLASETPYEICDFFIFKSGYTMTEAEKLFLDCVYSIKNTIDFMQK